MNSIFMYWPVEVCEPAQPPENRPQTIANDAGSILAVLGYFGLIGDSVNWSQAIEWLRNVKQANEQMEGRIKDLRNFAEMQRATLEGLQRASSAVLQQMDVLKDEKSALEAELWKAQSENAHLRYELETAVRGVLDQMKDAVAPYLNRRSAFKKEANSRGTMGGEKRAGIR